MNSSDYLSCDLGYFVKSNQGINDFNRFNYDINIKHFNYKAFFILN